MLHLLLRQFLQRNQIFHKIESLYSAIFRQLKKSLVTSAHFVISFLANSNIVYDTNIFLVFQKIIFLFNISNGKRKKHFPKIKIVIALSIYIFGMQWFFLSNSIFLIKDLQKILLLILLLLIIQLQHICSLYQKKDVLCIIYVNMLIL